MPNDTSINYTERLFSKGARKRLHLARFYWLERQTRNLRYPIRSVLEIGCFDGKALDFLPNPPKAYTGIDANWEGGLDIAREKYKGQQAFEFIEASRIKHISLNQTYEISICMETLEHVPPRQMEKYLDLLVEKTDKNIFITIPNELGFLFAAKYLAKLVFTGAQEISINDYINLTLKKADRVKRRGHIGFDYRTVITYFSTRGFPCHIESLPISWLPRGLAFTIAIRVDLNR